MNPTDLAQATVHAVIPNIAQTRFKAARREIEPRACLNPLRTNVWATAETMGADPYKRWRDMTNGVFCLVGE